MNINERSEFLANDFRESGIAQMNDLAVLAVANILRVHFLQVLKSAQHYVQRIAFGAFAAGVFFGGIVMLAVVVFYFGVR